MEFCRVCSILEGKAVSHDSDRLHTFTPATPITRIVTAGLAYLRGKKVTRGEA